MNGDFKIQPTCIFLSNDFKGTRCLGSVELVFEKRSVTVCYKIGMVRKIEYDDLHKYATKLHGFHFTS